MVAAGKRYEPRSPSGPRPPPRRRAAHRPSPRSAGIRPRRAIGAARPSPGQQLLDRLRRQHHVHAAIVAADARGRTRARSGTPPDAAPPPRTAKAPAPWYRDRRRAALDVRESNACSAAARTPRAWGSGSAADAIRARGLWLLAGAGRQIEHHHVARSAAPSPFRRAGARVGYRRGTLGALPWVTHHEAVTEPVVPSRTLMADLGRQAPRCPRPIVEPAGPARARSERVVDVALHLARHALVLGPAAQILDRHPVEPRHPSSCSVLAQNGPTTRRPRSRGRREQVLRRHLLDAAHHAHHVAHADAAALPREPVAATQGRARRAGCPPAPAAA